MELKLNVYAIYDSKSKQYENPFYVRMRGEALRMFADETNRPESKIYKHPEDYTLFELGTYSPDSGRYDSLDTPHSCGVAIEFHEAAKEAHIRALQ